MKSVAFVLAILECFSLDSPEWGVNEMARRLRRDKSIVSRTLADLVDGQMLVKDESTQRYRLGRKVVELSNVFLSRSEVRVVALPHLENLRKLTDETVSIFVVDGDHRICVERKESSQDMRYTIGVGQHFPLHAGASGKVLMAHMDPSRRHEIMVSAGLPAFTPNTINDEQKLEKELQKVRRTGFAISYGERVPFVASVGAPIRNHEGTVIATITVSAPSYRIERAKAKEYAVLVKQTANSISRELGYSRATRRTTEHAGLSKESPGSGPRVRSSNGATKVAERDGLRSSSRADVSAEGAGAGTSTG